MNPTAWAFVAMLYASDGTKHYHVGDTTYRTSTECIAIADSATRQMMSQRLGWAMCVPEDLAKGWHQ